MFSYLARSANLATGLYIVNFKILNFPQFGGLYSICLPSERSRVRISASPLPGNSLWQAARMHVPLSRKWLIWYQPMGGDALQMRR